MEKSNFIINPGSASRKYALYKEGRLLYNKHFENIKAGHENYLVKALEQSGAKDGIDLFGIRVVAPGEYFESHKEINHEYIEKLKVVFKLAPLHIKPELVELEELFKLRPNARVIGVSDTAFHASIPKIASQYAIDANDVKEFGIRRYGYHGISVSSVVREAANQLNAMPERVIVCHLGGGASITAVKNGASIDTSMGFTPIEGLIMSTRSGDIDPGAVLALMRVKKLSADEMENYLNTKCGLLGLSGKSDDIRELLKLEESGQEGAKLALEVYVYRIRKYIGAYMAALGGLDMLVFTATVGERSWILRERICKNLEGLGIALDDEKNKAAISLESFIDADSSRVRIAVIPTDEMGEMSREMEELLA